jgi:type IV secretory pathway VirJ component
MQRGSSGLSQWIPRQLGSFVAAVTLAAVAPLGALAAADASHPGARQAAYLEGVMPVSPPAAHAGTLMFVLSGDGGLWGDIDVQLAKKLAAEGYAVIALDTSVWFKDAQTPVGAAHRLEQALSYYLDKTKADRIVLVGYSYGADMIPLLYPHLSNGLRDRLDATVLLSPGRRTELQVTLAERTGIDPGDIDLAPSLKALPRDGLICLYGEDEVDESGCTIPEMADATLLHLPGGHHYDNDVDAMAQTLTPPIKQAAPP